MQTLGLYNGAIDGIAGQGTWEGVRRFCEEARRDCGQNFNGEDLRALAEVVGQTEIEQREVEQTQSQAPEVAIARHQALARNYFSRGVAAYDEGDLVEAERLLRLSSSLFSSVRRGEYREALTARHNLAIVLNDSNRTQH